MARVKEPKKESEFPVKAVIRTSPKAEGVTVEITLPFPASWKGRVLPLKQIAITDDNGEAVIYLPPTSEMNWLVTHAKGNPQFMVSVPGYGTFPVAIPSGVEEFTIGE